MWYEPLQPVHRAWFESGREERVLVPAGRFWAVPVETTVSRVGQQPRRVKHWYAREVGLVKWAAGTETEFVLKQFTLGKNPAP